MNFTKYWKIAEDPSWSERSEVSKHSHTWRAAIQAYRTWKDDLEPKLKPGEIVVNEAKLKEALMSVLNDHTREMEGYSYFGSNPGVPEDEYEEVANEVIKELFQKSDEG